MRITISLALGGGVAHHQEGLTEVRYIVKHDVSCCKLREDLQPHIIFGDRLFALPLIPCSLKPRIDHLSYLPL